MALIIQSSTFWKTSFPSTTWEGELNVNPLSKVVLGKENVNPLSKVVLGKGNFM